MKFKKIKFKDNSLSFKRFNQIIFEDNSITKTKYFGLRRPDNWHHKTVEPEFKPHPSAPAYRQKNNCYYRGKLVNGKYEGLGTEMILEDCNYMEIVISFYKGYWKKGKKNGKGYWSNHHPLIGRTWDLNAENPYYMVTDDGDDYYYDGYWLNDKKHGKGILKCEEGIFEGEFKDDSKWNGTLKVGVDKIIFKNGKKKESIVLPDKERFLARIDKGEHINLEKESEEIRSDKKLILRYFKSKSAFGVELNLVAKELKKDKSIVLAAVKKHTRNILYADRKFCEDKDVLKIIGNKKYELDKKVFKLLSNKFKNNKKIIIKLLKYKYEPKLYDWLSKKLQNDKKIAILGINNENYKSKVSKIYLKLNKKLQNDSDIIAAALKYKYPTLKKMTTKIQNNRNLMLKIMKRGSYGLYVFLNNEFKKQRDFLLAAKMYSPKYNHKLQKVVLD